MKSLSPTNVRILRSADGEMVKLVFEGESDSACAVEFDGSELLQLYGLIQSEVLRHPSQRSTLAPINRGALQQGQELSFEGCTVQSDENGGVEILLTVGIPDENRLVRLPLDMTDAAAGDLIAMIYAHLSPVMRGQTKRRLR